MLEESEGKATHPFIPGGYCNSIAPEKWFLHLSDANLISITERQINDKSKGDSLTKAIVLLQLLWFLTQVSARLSQRLALTELELATASYCVVATFIYTVWWKKPLPVDCYIPVTWSEPDVGDCDGDARIYVYTHNMGRNQT